MTWVQHSNLEEDSSLDEYLTTEDLSEEEDLEDEEDHFIDRFNNFNIQFPSLNQYFNNLNLNFNLNNRLNAFVTETSLWKLYENSQTSRGVFPHFPARFPRPKTRPLEAISNLWNQLADEESEARLKRLEFEAVKRKANEQVRRQLKSIDLKNQSRIEFESHKKEKYHREEEHSVEQLAKEQEEEEGKEKDQEFWKQFFDFKTESEAESSGGGDSPTRPNTKPPTNPFYHRFNLSVWDYFKLVLLFPLLVLRVLAGFTFLVLACLATFIGTLGLDPEEVDSKPFSTWRKLLRAFTAHVLMRAVCFCCGFQWVRRIGKQATGKEAPLLVAAPHSSYFDTFPVTLLGGPSVVAKDETKKTWFIGRLINFTQPIYVNRADASSRTQCARKIQERVKSEEDWPQVFVFPEGTCTNRSALAKFKPGAFSPGVPVQPVVIRFPNRLDCLTWTFDGPAGAWSFLVAMTQFWNSIELEYLPVYTPNEAEKNDANLYAQNVQKVMADALGVPATDFTLDDGVVLAKISNTKISRKLQKIWKVKGDLNLRESPTETTLMYEGLARENYEWNANMNRFMDIFHIDNNNESKGKKEVRELFKLFQQGAREEIDLRAYLILACFLLSDAKAKLDLLTTLMFKAYAKNRDDMTKEEFIYFMKNMFESSEKEANDLFYATTSTIGRRNDANSRDMTKTALTFQEFQRKVARRVEYVKLYAMNANGQVFGNFPRRSERDQRPKSKTE